MPKMTSKQWAEQRIKYFWEQKRIFDATKANFENDKYEFYNEMDRYFDSAADDDGKVIIDLRDSVKGVRKIICQKVTQMNITFNPVKIKKLLSKKEQKLVINKHYKVINWPGLLNLLKESGVEWKKFLKYVEITEEVNQKELDKLIDLGLLDIDDAKACASTKAKTQYYKITEK